MTGHSHTEKEGTPFAMAVMQKMNDKCSEWKAETDIDFSLYGTPLESTTYKFAKSLQRRFGNIPGVTDKGYITNSYHVHVSEEIDAFKKLEFESQFQQLSPGGAISYVEVPDMQDNLKAVVRVMQYIYDNIMYAELNTELSADITAAAVISALSSGTRVAPKKSVTASCICKHRCAARSGWRSISLSDFLENGMYDGMIHELRQH